MRDEREVAAVGDDPGKGPCQWCGDLDTVPFLVEPARFGVENGRKILRRRAIVVPACRRHADQFGQAE
jgi:hypothetical protein